MDSKQKKKEQLLVQAKDSLAKGAVMQAMKLYYDIAELEPRSEEILLELVVLNIQLQQFSEAIFNLNKLITLNPFKKAYYDQLAGIYTQSNQWSKVCEVYHMLLLQRPKAPDVHFNLAFYLRRSGQYDQALASYQRALDLGVTGPEEVYLNMSVICNDDLRQPEKAKHYLQQALEVNNNYLPAIYNLANIYEDEGELELATKQLQRILELQPEHAKALSRLAYLKKLKTQSDPLITTMAKVAASEHVDYSDKMDLCYAMGKALDDCGEYTPAFDYYKYANEMNKGLNPEYDKLAQTQFSDSIIEHFSQEWLTANAQDSVESPIFICGMFRSGSTLLEQVLASHPQVTAGGEREYFQKLVKNELQPFPESCKNLKPKLLQSFAENYINETQTLFPNEKNITDKRPDNLPYIGLIKSLFPKAKIVYTQRNAIDNCLSVYFLRLNKEMNYATSLANIAHFYKEQVRLMEHWKTLFPDSFYIFDYDQFVQNPEIQARKIINSIGLDWHEKCLEFHRLKNTVKTASAWQVRQPLYQSSSGRWKNYAQFEPVQELSNNFIQAK